MNDQYNSLRVQLFPFSPHDLLLDHTTMVVEVKGIACKHIWTKSHSSTIPHNLHPQANYQTYLT